MPAPAGNLVTPVVTLPDGSLSGLSGDASGNLIVTGPSPSILTPLPKSVQFTNLNLPAGNSAQLAFTVPAGTKYRLTGTAVSYVGTVAGVVLDSFVQTGASGMIYDVRSPIVSGVFYTIQLNILLDAGWSVQCLVLGATLNDDLTMNVFIEQVG